MSLSIIIEHQGRAIHKNVFSFWSPCITLRNYYFVEKKLHIFSWDLSWTSFLKTVRLCLCSWDLQNESLLHGSRVLFTHGQTTKTPTISSNRISASEGPVSADSNSLASTSESSSSSCAF